MVRGVDHRPWAREQHLRTLAEPTAAAMAYGLFVAGTKTMLVFDLGSGTLVGMCVYEHAHIDGHVRAEACEDKLFLLLYSGGGTLDVSVIAVSEGKFKVSMILRRLSLRFLGVSFSWRGGSC